MSHPEGVSGVRLQAALGGLPLRLIGLGVLLLFPVIINDAYVIHIGILALMYAALAMSWNLLCGYAGIFSMGHQAFFGLGAYTSALLAMRAGVSPWFGLFLAGLAASAASILIVLPTLRLRAPQYVAIATLAFAEVCRIVAQNLVDLTRGELGLNGIPVFPPLTLLGLHFDFAARRPAYYVMAALFLIVFWVVRRLVQSPVGLALQAIRESQDAAEALGVNSSRYKSLAFAVSAGLAGVVGAFYAHYIQVLTPSSALAVPLMVEVVAVTLVGGLGTLFGPVLGAVLLTASLEYLRFLGDYRLLLYGIGLVLLIMFMPEGLMRRLWRPRSVDVKTRPQRPAAGMSR